MSVDTEIQEEIIQEDELTVLKKRATLLGITYGPNTGLETLKKKIQDHLAESETPVKAEEKPLSERQLANQAKLQARREANKLIRVNVTCMNPNKKHLEGDIFTVSNSVVGTVRKYVKFDTEDGYHVPAIILQAMREKQCQIFVPHRTENGHKTSKGKLIKEYAIEVLPPLTEEELAELARRQAMAGSID